jgi:hypothetical protein
MATLTIRHVPEAIIERLKAAAKRKGHSIPTASLYSALCRPSFSTIETYGDCARTSAITAVHVSIFRPP